MGDYQLAMVHEWWMFWRYWLRLSILRRSGASLLMGCWFIVEINAILLSRGWLIQLDKIVLRS